MSTRDPGGGCGVQGCLMAAVALFVFLLLALLVIGFFRFRSPPAGRMAPPAPVSLGAAPAGAVAWLPSDARLGPA